MYRIYQTVYYAALLISVSTFHLMAGEAKRPNIVLIMADDMGYECLSANGCEDYNTPVLDKLAAEGMRFTQCFANPLCTPSRAKIMTGLYNIRNYRAFAILDRDQTTFAHLLKKAGYVTAVAGKWQLGKEPDSPQHFGFDQACLWQHRLPREDRGCDTRYSNPRLEVNGKVMPLDKGTYGPDICTDFLCDFIKENKDKPVLVYYPMILVHCPFTPTPDSKNWNPKSRGSGSYKGPGKLEDKKRHFKEMVEYTDKLVGKFIKTLEENGLRENTLFIFTGDNGTDKPIVTKWNGRTIAGDKGKVTDAGTRAPLIVNWPGRIKPAVETKELVEFSDFLPTLCEVTGAPLPANYPGDGVSLWPTLAGTGKRDKPHIYISYGNQKWARTVHYGARMRKTQVSYQHFPDHFKETNKGKLGHFDDEAAPTLKRLETVIKKNEKLRGSHLK